MKIMSSLAVADSQRRVVDLDSGDWQACEAAIRRFEAAWQNGPPEIAAFLPNAEPQRSAALAELIQVDLEFRLKRGERARVESYLQQFPELTADRAALLDLVRAERALRCASELSLDQREYGSRFPDLAAELNEPTVGPDAETNRGGPRPNRLAAESLPAIAGFEILEELGRGGMGVVYLARQTALQRLVAVKMLRGGAVDAEQRARFRTEMEAAARLKHPHIVQIHEVGEHAGQPYCVLEYVGGGNLQQALAGTPQAADVAARIIQQLALAVQHAHEQGIVHRDLKPANVLLEAEVGSRTSEVGGREEVTPDSCLLTPGFKIADFGLARQLEVNAAHTQTGDIVGTPAYMAPEQAAGQSKACGPATDVYSLGVILYELLTGRPPFQGASLLETLEQVRSQEPVPPRALVPRTPRDLNTICLKCLHKEPALRYSTAAALAADLAAFAEGRPIAARPVGLVERSWKAARRRPLVAGLTAAVVVVAAAGLTAGIYQYGQTTAALAATAKALTNEKAERLAKEVALVKTEESLADIKAFSQFVVEDIVSAAKPLGKDGGLGIDATIREALDAASKNLPQRFAGQPRAEAIARLDLGETYRAIGEPAQALVHFQEAVRLRRQLVGSDHAATMEAEDRLGSALRAQGKVKEAIALHEELLARCERVKGVDSQSALAVLYSLIQDLDEDGRDDEALLRSQHLVERTLAQRGPDHEATLKFQHQRASLLSSIGRWREALPLLEQVVATRTRLLGPEDPQTLTSLGNLAMIYRKQGRTAEALERYENNLRLTNAKLGPEHPRTLTAKAGVAQMYAQAGRHDEAIDLALEAHQTAQAKLGPTHPDALDVAGVLADAYEDADRLDDAVPLWEEIYRLRKQASGADHPSTLAAQSNLSSAYRQSSRAGDALKLAAESLNGLRKKLPPTHPKIVWALNNLGLAYKEAGQPDKALPLYQEVVASLTERYGPTSANTLTARNNLGGALLNLDRTDEAVQLSEETLKLCEQKLGPDDPTTLIVTHNLAIVYQNAGRDADAERLFRRAYEGRQVRFGADHGDTLQSQYRLAGIYLLRKNLDQAEPLLRDCQQRLKASPHAPSGLLNNVERALLVLAQVRANPALTPRGNPTSRSSIRSPTDPTAPKASP
jgi:tetratricopeptide (TPR) repeat protein